MTALLAPVLLVVPTLALALVQRHAWAAKAGTIVLCYAGPACWPATWAARWLRPRAAIGAAAAAATDTSMHDEDYRELLTRAGLAGATKSLGVAALVVAAAVGLGEAVGGANATALVIGLLATFGLLASLLPAVRALLSYKTGMYLIYVFSFTVASMARFDALRWTDLALLAFIVVAVFGSLALHALLARLAGIDAGTFLVTSVAAICSPAFVPLVARSHCCCDSSVEQGDAAFRGPSSPGAHADRDPSASSSLPGADALRRHSKGLQGRASPKALPAR